MRYLYWWDLTTILFCRCFQKQYGILPKEFIANDNKFPKETNTL